MKKKPHCVICNDTQVITLRDWTCSYVHPGYPTHDEWREMFAAPCEACELEEQILSPPNP